MPEKLLLENFVPVIHETDRVHYYLLQSLGRLSLVRQLYHAFCSMPELSAFRTVKGLP